MGHTSFIAPSGPGHVARERWVDHTIPENFVSSKRDRQSDGDVLVEKKSKTKKPKLYKVIFHNDDYTSMEFVIFVLEHVFRKTIPEATQIMLRVHKQGSGIAGVYPFSIAETKVAHTMELAKQDSYPLLVTMEPE